MTKNTFYPGDRPDLIPDSLSDRLFFICTGITRILQGISGIRQCLPLPGLTRRCE
ncbi:Uncharacterized protein dnm_008730 [Desulfonema magnum]|uniref:Uncharacterized protein n=1 Tax=Desulfonema magnum TaxID=45655 RepID=A0A975GKT4_9BACT|nr:Uncharacterized protein dnm_008730 [Desulfonema magnum]